MIKLKTLPEKVSQIFQDSLLDEYTASMIYRQGSQWFQNNGFEKAAKFLNAEADAEIGHANGIEQYLTNWNVVYTLPAIPAPENKATFQEWIDLFYKIEANLYDKYEGRAKQIFELGDMSAFGFIQKYVQIQYESVTEYSDMQNKLLGITGGKFELLMLEETLFGE